MMVGAAGGVGQTGVTEVYTAASAVAIPTIRTVAADLAARADFDLDSIADLRMAVDDTCTRLVRVAARDATLSCCFAVRFERIEVIAEVDVKEIMDPLPRGSFSWWVLRCLADEVTALVLPGKTGQGGRVCIILVKRALTAGLL
ncbi:MAG TPA: ATP-binding protein [Pseudonocardiaceae bacterium]|jgi:serine/threonine-protein kinase RsbW|nr:ATP-binding protein [Pseudonocardiaceae bacterium]